MKKIISTPIIVFLLLSFVMSCHCDQPASDTPNVTIPPDDLYLMDKMGEPTLDFLKLRSDEINSYKRLKESLRSPMTNFSGNWTTEGPGNLGGRVNTIAVNPKNENIIFIGFSHGGAYRTLDGGVNWTPIFDHEVTLYISDIAIDPKNTNIIYIGTGDHSGGYYCGQGNGIYKSTDNGLTWKNIGLQETKILSEIIVDYNNPNIIYAASLGYSYQKNEHRGIYKSTNGGTSWSKILFINDSTGFTDLVMHPENPNILFAVGWNKLGLHDRGVVSGPDGQIYKSTDGGFTWKKLTNGLPSDSLNGRIALAISTSESNILYARYVRTFRCNNRGATNNLYAIYKSNDTGETWEELPAITDVSGLDCNVLGGFGWYFDKIAVNPIDPDEIYIMGIDMFRSIDGGFNWELISPQWSTYEVHADKHDLVFMNNGDFLLGTDGGLYKHINSTNTWEDMEDIPTNQVYRVAYNPFETENYYGGLQDNGSTGGNAAKISNWDRIYGGDGFQMAFNDSDPTIYYAEYQNGALQQYYHGDWRSFTNGLRGNKNWDFPYMISRHNPSKLLAGSSQVYMNPLDTGTNWIAISPNLINNSRYQSRSNPSITCLDESPLDSNVLIAGTINGNVWLTKDFDKNWTDVSASLPIGYITSVKTSYVNSNTYYVSLSGLRSNDFNSYLFKSVDNGLSWTSIHNDLPALPVYDVLIYPNGNDSILFVGNHIGVYASVDGGNSWMRVGDNMPFIEVFDVEINLAKNTLIAATFGKSIMSFPIKEILKQIVKVHNTVPSTDIIAYPNPASDLLNVNINAENIPGQIKIGIYDHFGKLCYSKFIENTNQFTIPLVTFKNGIYFLKFILKNQNTTIPFTKM